MRPVSRRQLFLDLLTETRVYAVTDDRLESRKLIGVVEAALRGGVRLFQLRDKRRSDRERVALAQALGGTIRKQGGLLIVNDRADLALAADSDGVHLGQDDLPVATGRKLVGQDRIVGASASYLAEIPIALEGGVDYLGFGAVYPTDTKPDAEYAGLDLLREACGLCPAPVVAIGGISGERAREVLAQGPRGIAVVSALFRSANVEEAARTLIAACK
ncbi:MAG: thiamine phosphate synthase [Chloroflexi bacterium]|nr:thiamine phosphate synthase [Chloroflexota bacterium]